MRNHFLFLGGHMRPVLLVVALFLFAGTLPAQPGAAIVKTANTDTAYQAGNGAGPECGAAFHRGTMPSPCCRPEMRMGPHCWAPMPGQQCGQWCGPQFPRRHHFPAGRVFAGFFVLGLLLYSAMNILLTIIVTRDMLRNKCFAGLWIPVILIAGIPGTALYALLRIADGVRCRETTAGA